MTAPRNINKVTIAKQPDLYGQVPYEYRKQPVITETVTVELRDLRKTLEFIQKTADQYIIDGGSPHLLIVDVLTYASIYCRGVNPRYSLNTEIVCGNYLSDEPTMTIVDERGYDYSARLFFKKEDKSQETIEAPQPCQHCSSGKRYPHEIG